MNNEKSIISFIVAALLQYAATFIRKKKKLKILLFVIVFCDKAMWIKREKNFYDRNNSNGKWVKLSYIQNDVTTVTLHFKLINNGQAIYWFLCVLHSTLYLHYMISGLWNYKTNFDDCLWSWINHKRSGVYREYKIWKLLDPAEPE